MYLNVTLKTLFFSYSQITYEEGIPLKRLTNIYDFCEQIRTFLYLYSSVSLRATVLSKCLLMKLQPEPAVLMLYLYVRLSCFKLSILVDLYVILILSQKNACALLTFPMPTIMIKSVPNNVISLYFFVRSLPVRSLGSCKGK